MRAHFAQPAFLYEATRVYLMLGSAGPLDRDLVKEWMSLDWQIAMARSCRERPARQPGAPPRRAARPTAGEGAAGRRADRGRAPHVQPRHPGRPCLQHDQGLAAGARIAALAAGRCRGCIGRARVHPPLRRAAERGRARLLHHRRIPQGAAAQPAHRHRAGGQRKLGTGQGCADRSAQPADADAAARRDRALYRRLRQAVGRPAGRSRRRADAQSPAGGAGAVHPGLAAVADARPAGRHHAAAHPDAAARLRRPASPVPFRARRRAPPPLRRRRQAPARRHCKGCSSRPTVRRRNRPARRSRIATPR